MAQLTPDQQTQLRESHRLVTLTLLHLAAYDESARSYFANEPKLLTTLSRAGDFHVADPKVAELRALMAETSRSSSPGPSTDEYTTSTSTLGPTYLRPTQLVAMRNTNSGQNDAEFVQGIDLPPGHRPSPSIILSNFDRGSHLRKIAASFTLQPSSRKFETMPAQPDVPAVTGNRAPEFKLSPRLAQTKWDQQRPFTTNPYVAELEVRPTVLGFSCASVDGSCEALPNSYLFNRRDSRLRPMTR